MGHLSSCMPSGADESFACLLACFQLSSAALRKVSKELQSLQTCPPEGIRIQVDEANLTNLVGWIGVYPFSLGSGWLRAVRSRARCTLFTVLTCLTLSLHWLLRHHHTKTTEGPEGTPFEGVWGVPASGQYALGADTDCLPLLARQAAISSSGST